MQEKWKELQVILEEMKTIKKREYFLMLAVCVLSGLVVGMLVSPRKQVMVGSNNGNNNRSSKGDAGSAIAKTGIMTGKTEFSKSREKAGKSVKGEKKDDYYIKRWK